MHSLVAKIFLAYWLAAGVVIVIVDLQPHKLVHTPELADALDTSLIMNGRGLVSAYKSGNCASVSQWHARPGDGMALTSPDGKLLCGDLNLKAADLRQIIAGAVAGKKLTTRDFSRYQVIAQPIALPDGSSYVLLVKSQYSSVLHVFGSLPGSKTIGISVVVTFFLAILVVLPLRRLRGAARQISGGNLSARVNAGLVSRLMARIRMRDDIDGLMHDFNAMADRLQSLVTAQKLLMRDVSHELRSPLARLAVALELAKDGPRESIPVHLARIERESLRLNSLIGHILSFSYIESVRDLRHSDRLSLNTLVQELLPDVQYEAEGRHCQIVTSTSRDCMVTGDPDMLRHAVENIVRNAIRYSPAGGTVEIDIDTEEKDGRPGAVLRVSDTGPGVAEEKLNLILNPFYRAESSRRGTTSGFGIGLAIADRAAHLHAGQIVAKNRTGGGLIVEMSLPLEPAYS